MMRVLLVSGSPRTLTTLRPDLRAGHYDVHVVPDTGQGAGRPADWRPDVVLLDLGPSGVDGVESVRGLRDWTEAAIIVLSGWARSRDKAAALDAGADDYVTEPYGVDELLARIRAISRRTSAAPTTRTVRLGPWLVDLVRKTVTGDDGRKAHLTPTEWSILELLLRKPGELVPHRMLLTEIWGADHADRTVYLRVYLRTLRRKLEAAPSSPRHLINEPGLGYRFDP
ncbi:winged helix-turn-helix domain-containing protein [Actinomadura sp. 1N219]|uniref:winged helix-turn-helix domain-containing protein n=1 Tax=Actinomadura sp. 1N219 TaxID=3375152 RepID=UPI0037AD9D40